MRHSGPGALCPAVRTADETLQLWLDLANPVQGTAYVHPEMGDQKVALGSPYDTWPPNTHNRGIIEHATIEMTVFEPEVRFAGTVDVAWLEDAANGLPAADVAGSFDITCESQ